MVDFRKYRDRISGYPVAYVTNDLFRNHPEKANLHYREIFHPTVAGLGLVSLLTGWVTYANSFRDHGFGHIGEDYYAVREWAEIGKSIIALLSIQSSPNLDMESIDEQIRGILAAEGIEI